MTQDKSRYEPKNYEPMSLHVAFFFVVVTSLIVNIFKISTIPLWQTAIGCAYLLAFPLFAAYLDFCAMCRRREMIETYWSD